MRTTILILGVCFLKQYGNVGGDKIMPFKIFIALLILCVMTDIFELMNKIFRQTK